jgi:2-polyprenyl-3-methyl-5-hydroxy-6-metoxy-1,4-benzoquinol methylase
MSDGTITMSDVVDNEGVSCRPAPTCILCGQERAVLYPKQRDRFFSAPGIWDVRWCPPCELAWLDPRPFPEEVVKLYESYYTHELVPSSTSHLQTLRRWLRDGVLGTWMGYEELVRSPVHRMLGWVLGWPHSIRDVVGLSVMTLVADQRGWLLDVGCGNGQFLARMRDLGWDVAGVEPDPSAARIARQRFGLNVYNGILEGISLREQSFDAITMNHVAEHLHDPVGTFRRCGRLLKGNGLLVIITPNLRSIGHRFWRSSWRDLDIPRHLFLFTGKSLAACLGRAGLAVRSMRTTSRSASWIWRVSAEKARSGLVASAFPSQRARSLLAGWSVQLLESSFPWNTWAGEELIVAAGPCQRD